MAKKVFAVGRVLDSMPEEIRVQQTRYLKNLKPPYDKEEYVEIEHRPIFLQKGEE